jgi:hypothetical protein
MVGPKVRLPPRRCLAALAIPTGSFPTVERWKRVPRQLRLPTNPLDRHRERAEPVDLGGYFGYLIVIRGFVVHGMPSFFHGFAFDFHGLLFFPVDAFLISLRLGCSYLSLSY